LLTTKQLLERLGSRLDLLRGGRDTELRQRTLRATIEWSYDLLTARFGMLETIRKFAAERLSPTDRDELLRRLLEHLLELAQSAGLYEEGGVQRPELIVPERANVEVALAWALETGEISLGIRLIWLLELHLATGDPLAAREWIDAFLARPGGEVEAGLRARALRVRGATFDMTGRSDLAEREYERAQELFRAAGEDEAATHLLNRIAMSALQQGDFERAARLGSEALDLDRRRGHRRDEAIALSIRAGTVAVAGGDREDRRPRQHAGHARGRCLDRRGTR
jgi:tetratricopeptide (TPR) repeat protein